jgi:hypothetical protein
MEILSLFSIISVIRSIIQQSFRDKIILFFNPLPDDETVTAESLNARTIRKPATPSEHQNFSAIGLYCALVPRAPNMLTTLGVLGTFVGLMLLFLKISPDLLSAPELKQGSTLPPSKALAEAANKVGFAFYTSVEGIFWSFFIQLLMSIEKAKFGLRSVWDEGTNSDTLDNSNDSRRFLKNYANVLNTSIRVQSKLVGFSQIINDLRKSADELYKKVGDKLDSSGEFQLRFTKADRDALRDISENARNTKTQIEALSEYMKKEGMM